MKIKKIISLGILVGLVVFLVSCSDDYDERFDKLEQQLQDVIAQVEGASELATAIDALEAQIGSLQGAVTGLSDDDALEAGLSSLAGEITALETELANLGSAQATSVELENLVAGLTSDLDLLKSDLDTLLQGNNVLTGDLIIFDDASLQAALSLGDKVRIITGKMHVVQNDLQASAINEVTSRVVTVNDDLRVVAEESLDLSKLESVGDDIAVVGHPVDLGMLRSVGGNLGLGYIEDYDLQDLELVAGTIYLGVYIKTNTLAFKTEALERTINFRKAKANAVKLAINAEMDLGNGVYDMEYAFDEQFRYPSLTGVPNYYNPMELNFPNATSVIFGNVPVNYLIAPKAETIELHYEGSIQGAFTVIAPANDITAKLSGTKGGEQALIVAYPFDEDFTLAAFLDGYVGSNYASNDFYENALEQLNIPADWTSKIELPNLESVEGDLALISHVLSMPLLEKFGFENYSENALSLTQENVVLPNLAINGHLYAKATVSAELASLARTTIAGEVLLEALTINAQLNDVITNGTINGAYWEALTTLAIYGSTDVEDGIEVDLYGDCETYPMLETITLGGVINAASLSDIAELTNVSTSGNINSLAISNNDKLLDLTLVHEHIAGLDGASLSVFSNDLLESVKTENLDYVNSLDISSNGSLSQMDFSSMKTVVNNTIRKPSSAYLRIHIVGNSLSGTYENYIPQTGTTLSKTGKVTTADLYTLKSFMDAIVLRAENSGAESVNDIVELELVIDAAVDSNSEGEEPIGFTIDNADDFSWENGDINFEFDYVFDTCACP